MCILVQDGDMQGKFIPGLRRKYSYDVNRRSGCLGHVHTESAVASSIPSCRLQAWHLERMAPLRHRLLQAIVSARTAIPTSHRYLSFSASSARVMQRQRMHLRLRVISLIVDLPPARFVSTHLLSIISRSRISQRIPPLLVTP